MTEDFLDWMCPPADWSLEWHLSDPLTNDCYCSLLPEQVWFTKNAPAQGFKGFDLNTFDENFIYQKLTENGWVNKNFKGFLGPGIPFCPRYFVPGQYNPPIVIPNTSFDVVTNCAIASQTQNVGVGVTQLSGPYPATDPLAAFGGDIGTLPYCKITWQWNTGGVMETFYYAKPFGWVKWTTANLVASQYVIQTTSLFNKIVAGGFGPINFPCPIPA